MNLDGRIESLKAKHAALDEKLRSEVKRSYPDNQHLIDLKRKKLEIKEEIDRLSL